MIISFCFTIKILNNKLDLNSYIKLIHTSIEYAKQHHIVKFYTDIETLSHLSISNVEVVLIDTSDFYFVDDFKIHLLSIISDDEVLIDTDLFLFETLKLEDNKDIYVDFRDNSKKYWYEEYIKWFLDNGIDELIPNFYTKDIVVPNIGILKIPNIKLKKEYIKLYYKIRKWAISKNINIDKGISIILGQYLLALLIDNKKYSISYCHKKNNHYIHLSGPLKFESNILDNIISIKNKKII